MWLSRLLSSSPGAPEMHNACLLLAVLAQIVLTAIVVLYTHQFDPIVYATGIGLMLGGTGVAAVLASKGRQIEGDKPTPNENSLPPPKT